MRFLRVLGAPAAIVLGGGAAAILAAVVVLATGIGGPPVADVVEVWVLNGLALCGGLICCRQAFRPPERLPWALIGAAFLSWALANTYWGVKVTTGTVIEGLSLADVGWLLFYPFACTGLVLLARRRIAGRPAPWLDGLVASLTAAAVLGILVLDRVLRATGHSTEQLLVYLAYGIGDVSLFGLTVGALVVCGARGRTTWSVLAASFGVFLLADSFYLVQSVQGGFQPGTILSVGWPAAALLAALASCLPRHSVAPMTAERWRRVIVPAACGAVSLSVLVASHFGERSPAGVLFAAAAVCAVIARLVVVVRENHALLRATRIEALRDPLTGLGNRRSLHADFAAQVDAGRPCVLAFFDLDGFKEFNDSYGHAAGDGELARVGALLTDVVAGAGNAYRVGGDEFCVLVGAEHVERVERLCAELVQGPFGASAGICEVPREAADLATATEIADSRMYAHKRDRGRSIGGQVADLVTALMAERSPELGVHAERVAQLAQATGFRLGLDSSSLATLHVAARLHDLGALGLPDALVNKLGPFDASERTLMADQTLIGERVLSESPALAAVGRIVRSVRERVDGTGLPDGCAGSVIPVEARIIAVCEAFESMTAGRRGRDALSMDAALEELYSAADRQFDRAVVEALEEVLATVEPPAPRQRALDLSG